MADEELKQYPRGQVSFDGGQLRQCTDFEWDYTNNAKLIATLAANPSGVVTGNRALSFTFNIAIDADGAERDYFEAVESGTPKGIRIKLPGGVTRTIVGVVSGFKGSITLEEGVKGTVTGVGKFVKR